MPNKTTFRTSAGPHGPNCRRFAQAKATEPARKSVGEWMRVFAERWGVPVARVLSLATGDDGPVAAAPQMRDAEREVLSQRNAPSDRETVTARVMEHERARLRPAGEGGAR